MCLGRIISKDTGFDVWSIPSIAENLQVSEPNIACLKSAGLKSLERASKHHLFPVEYRPMEFTWEHDRFEWEQALYLCTPVYRMPTRLSLTIVCLFRLPEWMLSNTYESHLEQHAPDILSQSVTRKPARLYPSRQGVEHLWAFPGSLPIEPNFQKRSWIARIPNLGLHFDMVNFGYIKPVSPGTARILAGENVTIWTTITVVCVSNIKVEVSFLRCCEELKSQSSGL